jgi:hypothetical protein
VIVARSALGDLFTRGREITPTRWTFSNWISSGGVRYVDGDAHEARALGRPPWQSHAGAHGRP